MKRYKNIRVSSEFWEALEEINKDYGTPKTEITRKIAHAISHDPVEFKKIEGWKKKKKPFEFRI
jgi:hypothetical protein|tara:strand:+ start:3261 stop:3452 length:192 start_codon:yes stop_codon:yes gene_type:complete